MAESLEDFLNQIRRDRSIVFDVEEATRQGIVLPVLGRLGWDRDNIREVVPEFPVGNGKVDYCLKIGEKKSVFIEVKRGSEDLESHQEQLLEYAFRDSVDIAVLTNGLVWWLYLPRAEGSWEQRKFFAIDVQQQEVQAAAQHFREFLAREAVAAGTALERASTIHAGKERVRIVREIIPKAWNNLCQEPDEALLELFASKVESLCGHKADVQHLADFLAARGVAQSGASRTVADRKKAPVEPSLPAKRIATEYTNTRPVAYSFRGQRFPVSTFREILISLAGSLHASQPSIFERVLTLRSTKRTYFSREYKGMTNPVEIPGTGIYAETHMDGNRLIKLAKDVLELLGYSRDDLVVEVEDR